MREGIHPEYRKVVFVDVSTGTEFVTRSTVRASKTREVEGEELPEVRVEISSASHPFYTGTMREIDTAGKIERFRRRYQNQSR